ncbi:hypothetical protein VKT23_009345 [Stygiomarasmius scandens]|uniref:NAD(P)-binding protein n=1 Tax=Marasmiellus scandens TaxID=2682957 RepID=A0ABR1JG22_9AGAR
MRRVQANSCIMLRSVHINHLFRATSSLSARTRTNPSLTLQSIRTMSDKPITAYKNSVELPPQEQNLPGLDKEMGPAAEHSQVEWWDNGKPFLKEYQGSGKLLGKKAIITGGDSGIGRSAAVFFAREGADVSIVYLPEEQTE